MVLRLSFHDRLVTEDDLAYFEKKLNVSVPVAPGSVISLRALDGSESVACTDCGRLSISAAAVAPLAPIDEEDAARDEEDLDAGAMHTNGGPLGADVDPGDMTAAEQDIYRAAILSAATVRVSRLPQWLCQRQRTPTSLSTPPTAVALPTTTQTATLLLR
jgi:hypothetical protein